MAINTVDINRVVKKFTVASLGTATVDIPILNGVAYKLVATVIGVNISGSNTRMWHQQTTACVCNPTTGAPAFETVFGSDTNPVLDTDGNRLEPPQFVSGAPTHSSATWGFSGSNARLTILNGGAGTNDFAAIIDVYAASTL